MKSRHVRNFIDKLISLNPSDDACMFLDSAHRHRTLQKSVRPNNAGRLFILLPPYSPELNLQETIWGEPKDDRAHNEEYEGKELSKRLREFQVYLYNTPSKLKRHVDP